MASPAVTSAEEEDTEPDANSNDDGDDDVEMVETSVSETGADPDGFFDDIEEDAGTATDPDDIFDGTDGDEPDDDGGSFSNQTPSLATDINRGAARLACIGLDEEWETESGETQSKDDLQDEFQETFEAFRLGHYAGITIEEYLMVEADDIHPVWGLVGAMLICAAVVVYRRPDGDQLIDDGKAKLGDFSLDTDVLKTD